MKMFSFISLAALLFISTVNSSADSPAAKAVVVDPSEDPKAAKIEPKQTMTVIAEQSVKNAQTALAKEKAAFKLAKKEYPTKMKKLENNLKTAQKNLKTLDPKNELLKTSGQSQVFPSLIALSVLAIAYFV